MAVVTTFDPHLRVFAAARAQLTRLGFSLPVWQKYQFQVPEFPRPALMYRGSCAEIDLESDTASYPHPLEFPAVDTYQGVIDGLLRPRAKAVGRPQTAYWRGWIDEDSTSFGSILTPSRCGYYDAARPQFVFGYHAAECAYLLYKQADEDGDLNVTERDFFVELDFEFYGVLEGKVFVPGRQPIALDHEFDPGLLLQFRYAKGLQVPRNLTMWRAIGAFCEERGIADADPDLMQALSHCRFALPETLAWFDTPAVLGGTPLSARRMTGRRTISVRPQDKALALEAAYSLLRTQPRIPINEVRRRVVPIVMSAAEWRERVGPLARLRLRRRTQILDLLKHMHEELLSQV